MAAFCTMTAFDPFYFLWGERRALSDFNAHDPGDSFLVLFRLPDYPEPTPSFTPSAERFCNKKHA
jgi:hypothetical protein